MFHMVESEIALDCNGKFSGTTQMVDIEGKPTNVASGGTYSLNGNELTLTYELNDKQIETHLRYDEDHDRLLARLELGGAEAIYVRVE
jgi:hypothetical protein